jgi:hypothetical protein
MADSINQDPLECRRLDRLAEAERRLRAEGVEAEQRHAEWWLTGFFTSSMALTQGSHSTKHPKPIPSYQRQQGTQGTFFGRTVHRLRHSLITVSFPLGALFP